MQIQDHLRAKGITHLYHFTDEENIPLIKEHGILPYTHLIKKDIIPPKPGGNQWSREADSRSGVDAYVHLCFLDNHPMEYLASQSEHIGRARYLKISLDVLAFTGVKGCSDVSNKSGVIIRPIEKALDQMDLQILFGNKVDFTNQELRNRYNEAKKSEVLIPASIPPNLILNLT